MRSRIRSRGRPGSSGAPDTIAASVSSTWYFARSMTSAGRRCRGTRAMYSLNLRMTGEIAGAVLAMIGGTLDSD
jgi:hypothetical protein